MDVRNKSIIFMRLSGCCVACDAVMSQHSSWFILHEVEWPAVPYSGGCSAPSSVLTFYASHVKRCNNFAPFQSIVPVLLPVSDSITQVLRRRKWSTVDYSLTL